MNVRTNGLSMFVWRQMGQHQSRISTAIQRLSSGLRINSAADDPSGMCISQRMKRQLSALKSEQSNVLDGMSLVERMEAPLIETQKMLGRMAELAQRAAGGLGSDLDLEALDAEYQQLLDEIGRSGKAVDLPSVKLFSEAQRKPGSDAAPSGGDLTYRGGNLDAFLDGLNVFLGKINQAAQNNDSLTLEGLGLSVSPAEDHRAGLQDAVLAFTRENAQKLLDSPVGATQDDGGNYTIFISGGNITIKAGASGSGGGYGLEGTGLLSPESAANAQEAVKNAMKEVSRQRSYLGATRNRLEHATNNLATMEENLSASLSRVQDADMAKEMMNLAREQILSQAAAFLLAQTNRKPEEVITLLSSL